MLHDGFKINRAALKATQFVLLIWHQGNCIARLRLLGENRECRRVCGSGDEPAHGNDEQQEKGEPERYAKVKRFIWRRALEFMMRRKAQNALLGLTLRKRKQRGVAAEMPGESGRNDAVA